jgi:hypothetical protein
VKETYTLWKIALIRRIRETWASLGIIPSVIEAGMSCEFFPYEH